MLFIVPPSHVCVAWKEGASALGAACALSAGEVTPDQLKLMLTRGEKVLIGLRDDNETRAWAAVQIEQMPNKRVLFIYAIYAPGATGPEAIEELRRFAREQGCEAIRGACNDAVQRLWERKFSARKAYSIVEIDL